MQEDNEELERFLRTLSNGIEKKITTESISDEDVKATGKIIEITNDTSLNENTGGIQEQITFKIRTLSCGCVAQGRQDIGGICQKCGNIVCKKHFYRCLRCRKGLCCKCVSSIESIVYCKKCARITKFLRLLRLKK